MSKIINHAVRPQLPISVRTVLAAGLVRDQTIWN